MQLATDQLLSKIGLVLYFGGYLASVPPFNFRVYSKPGPNFEDLYEIRSRLLALGHIVVPMRELLYRILNLVQLEIPKEERLYFQDVDDHLLKLTQMIESNREITADMRDSFVSLYGHHYEDPDHRRGHGMNFNYMPSPGGGAISRCGGACWESLRVC